MFIVILSTSGHLTQILKAVGLDQYLDLSLYLTNTNKTKKYGPIIYQGWLATRLFLTLLEVLQDTTARLIEGNFDN